MSRYKRIYHQAYIIKRFQWELFQQIPEKNLIAVVINIQPRLKSDIEVLEKWEDHFRQKLPIAGLPEPYVITQDPKSKIKMLWKERRA